MLPAPAPSAARTSPAISAAKRPAAVTVQPTLVRAQPDSVPAPDAPPAARAPSPATRLAAAPPIHQAAASRALEHWIQRVAAVRAAIPAPVSPVAVPTLSRAAARPVIASAIEIGDIVVELGVAAPASRPRAQTGSLLAAIPSFRMAGGRR
jgi:hypothetical protein